MKWKPPTTAEIEAWKKRMRLPAFVREQLRQALNWKQLHDALRSGQSGDPFA